MSELDNFNNQTPHDPNLRPDYSYDWKGNERSTNKDKKHDIATVIAIVLGSVALMAVIVAMVVFFISRSNFSISQKNTSEDSSVISENPEGINNNSDNSSIYDSSDVSDAEEESRPDYSVPDFTPSGDADADLSNLFTQIYDNCSPSCCTVTVYQNGALYSIGSGFVIDSTYGYIATNHHVIESGDKIKVVFYNGDEYEATLVGSDANTDLAVLSVDADNLKQVEFGDSDNIKVGETVVAIGTPYDQSLAGTMTSGIISGVARGVEITNSAGKVIKVMTLLQTDCSINPGNSGGPLIDMAGNVVGITSLKLVDEKFEGIGFAIPITDALDIFEKLIAGEPITDNGIASASPRIGVTVYELEYGFSTFRISPQCLYPTGVLVGDIEVSSSAYKAGLSRLDIITDFNGYTIESIDDLNAALNNYKAGDEVEVTVFRFDRSFKTGKTEIITFKLDAAE